MFGAIRNINLNEEGKEPWKFSGSKLNFLDTVLWAIAFREAYKNQDDFGNILNDLERK